MDDFTTFGSSCETSRHLFEKVGVEHLIFISMGKYGKEYHKWSYLIAGDVHDDYSYRNKTGSPKMLSGDFHSKTGNELKRLFE